MNSQLRKGGISGILDKDITGGFTWIRWYEAQFIQLVVGSKFVSGDYVIADQFDQMVEQRYLCRYS